jgi:hypothetical protein
MQLKRFFWSFRWKSNIRGKLKTINVCGNGGQRVRHWRGAEKLQGSEPKRKNFMKNKGR